MKEKRVWGIFIIQNIVLKPDPARWVDPRLGWPGAGTGPDLRKNRKSQNSAWPGDPVDPARFSQKPGCNPLIFVCFLLKKRRFDFFKKSKLTRETRSKSGIQSLNRTGFINAGSKERKNEFQVWIVLFL